MHIWPLFRPLWWTFCEFWGSPNHKITEILANFDEKTAFVEKTQGSKKVEISAKIGRKTTFVDNFFKNIFSNLVGKNILKFWVS